MPGTRYTRSGAAAQGPCIYMVRYFREYYRRSSRELQRLESLSRSPVRRLLSPATLAPSCLLRPGRALPTPRPIQTHTILAHASQQAAAQAAQPAIMAFSVRCAAQQPHHLGGLVCAATATVLGLCALLRDAQRTGHDPRVRARGIGCRSCCSAPPGLCSRAAKSPPGAHRPAQLAASRSAGAAAVAGEQPELACAFVSAAGAQHPQARRAPPGEL